MRGRAVRYLLAVSLVPGGVAAVYLAAGLVDTSLLKEIADSLAPDGRTEKFSLERLEETQPRLLLSGLAWLAITAVSLLLTWRYGDALGALWSDLRQLPRRLRLRAAALLREEPAHLAALAALVVIAAAGAILRADHPLRCDEGGNFLRLVTRPWYLTLVDYDTPNNHIFHTLLVHLSCALFGTAPWCIRLPALLAGVALIPAAYAGLRAHLGRDAALLAAALLATSTYVLDFATNARGYTMLTAIFMLLLALLPHLLKRSRPAWLAFVVLASLGLYTVPVMLYPLAIVLVWCAVSLFTRAERGRLRSQALWIASAFAAVGAVSWALYSPAEAFSHVAARLMTTNRFQSLPPSLPESMATSIWAFARRLPVVWDYWSFNQPRPLAWCLLGAAALSPLAGRGSRRLLVASVLGLAALLAATRRLPPVWTLLYLLPLYFGFAGAGVVAVMVRLNRLAGSLLERRAWTAALAAAALALVPGWRTLATSSQVGHPWYIGYPEAREAAAVLMEEVRPDAVFEGGGAVAYPIRYWFYRRGLHCPEFWRWQAATPPRAVYTVDTGDGGLERVEEELRRQGFTRCEVVKPLASSRILRFTREEPVPPPRPE